MTAKGIRVLIRRLFKESQLDPLYKAVGRRVSVDEMERRALLDPGFLGCLVVWFSDAGQPLPEFITHPALVRMSRFLLEPGRPDPDLKVALAIALNLPGSEAQRDVLRGVLICPGATLESTATLLGADLEVVSLFETLHWNVLDRKEDRPYIAKLCGKIGPWGTPGGVQSCGALGSELLRIAYELASPEAILAKAGVSPLSDPVGIQTLLERIRSSRLASAAVGLALNKISDQENPELREALRIIAAMKKAKAENDVVMPPISLAEGAIMVMEKHRKAFAEEQLEATQIYDESLVRAELNKKSSGANGPGTAPAGQQTQ